MGLLAAKNIELSPSSRLKGHPTGMQKYLGNQHNTECCTTPRTGITLETELGTDDMKSEDRSSISLLQFRKSPSLFLNPTVKVGESKSDVEETRKPKKWRRP